MHTLTPFLLALAPALLALPASAQAGDPPVPEDTEIVTTATGLQYSVLQAGEGEDHPRLNDTVKVHYTGWLTTGKMFDSSRQRGNPAEFKVSQVIEGWTEGLQLMTPGARFKFTIPASMGYGFDGSPPIIPADATLIFDVELLEISKRGREIPVFQALDAETSKVLESGIRYQILEAGSGAPCTLKSMIGIEYTIWTGDGGFMNSTAMQDGPMFTSFEKITLPFMPEIVPFMKVGGTLLVEIPYENGIKNARVPKDSPTIWRWTVTHEFTAPTFVLPADEELTTTESGLKYKMIKEGSGKSPAVTDQVQCHYSGWLLEGTPFDSSYDRGAPSTFPLNGVIKGWTEGLQLIKEGGKCIFVIPGDLAYGPRGKGATIPPDATLVFVVELVKVL